MEDEKGEGNGKGKERGQERASPTLFNYRMLVWEEKLGTQLIT